MDKKYFTISKAKRIISKNFKEVSDIQLQKDIVVLRDFERYMNDTILYRDILLDGDYFKSAVTQSSRGLVPSEMWLCANIKYALDLALKEKQNRMEDN